MLSARWLIVKDFFHHTGFVSSTYCTCLVTNWVNQNQDLLSAVSDFQMKYHFVADESFSLISPCLGKWLGLQWISREFDMLAKSKFVVVYTKSETNVQLYESLVESIVCFIISLKKNKTMSSASYVTVLSMKHISITQKQHLQPAQLKHTVYSWSCGSLWYHEKKKKKKIVPPVELPNTKTEWSSNVWWILNKIVLSCIFQWSSSLFPQSSYHNTIPVSAVTWHHI